MAETTIRWQAIRRIVDLARERPELTDVNVSTVYPGDEAGAECIYVGDLTGPLTVPVTRAASARVTYDDRFDITWAIEAWGADPDTTMARADQIIAAFQDVIATESQLDDLDGVVTARITDLNGPLGTDTRNGILAVAQIVVSVHARYTS